MLVFHEIPSAHGSPATPAIGSGPRVGAGLSRLQLVRARTRQTVSSTSWPERRPGLPGSQPSVGEGPEAEKAGSRVSVMAKYKLGDLRS